MLTGIEAWIQASKIRRLGWVTKGRSNVSPKAPNLSLNPSNTPAIVAHQRALRDGFPATAEPLSPRKREWAPTFGI